MDVLATPGHPEIERVFMSSVEASKTGLQGFLAFAGASRATSEMETTSTGRVFRRVARIRPLMGCVLWYADLNETYSSASSDTGDAFGYLAPAGTWRAFDVDLLFVDPFLNVVTRTADSPSDAEH